MEPNNDEAEFRKKFPNLAKELEGGERIRIEGVRSDAKEGEKAAKTFESHDPAAIDFLRRCDTEEQGIEIIDYLKARGEIDKEYANRLKVQLLQKGVGSFGVKKEAGHYLLR